MSFIKRKINLEGECYNQSNAVYENGSCRESFDKFTYNKYIYIRGNDLLRGKPNGEFISTYPGVSSSRVTNAIKDGGVLWEQP